MKIEFWLKTPGIPTHIGDYDLPSVPREGERVDIRETSYAVLEVAYKTSGNVQVKIILR